MLAISFLSTLHASFPCKLLPKFYLRRSFLMEFHCCCDNSRKHGVKPVLLALILMQNVFSLATVSNIKDKRDKDVDENFCRSSSCLQHPAELHSKNTLLE
jgi:hypothetical protein